MENNQQYKSILLREYKSIHADILACDAIIEKYKETQNKNHFSIAGGFLERALNKSLKAIIHVDRPDIYNALDENGERKIAKTYDIRVLLDKVEKCRPGFLECHEFISENADNFKLFNLLRSAKRSIDSLEFDAFSEAVKDLVNELGREVALEHTNDKANFFEDYYEWRVKDKCSLIILNRTSAEMCSLYEENGYKPVNRKGFSIINAYIEGADENFTRKPLML